MSNYPPGVSGSEPEIVGSIETQIRGRCENVVAEGVDWLHGQVAGSTEDFDVECGWHGTLDVALDEAEEEWVGECPSCALEIRVLAETAHTVPFRRQRSA